MHDSAVPRHGRASFDRGLPAAEEKPRTPLEVLSGTSFRALRTRINSHPVCVCRSITTNRVNCLRGTPGLSLCFRRGFRRRGPDVETALLVLKILHAFKGTDFLVCLLRLCYCLYFESFDFVIKHENAEVYCIT